MPWERLRSIELNSSATATNAGDQMNSKTHASRTPSIWARTLGTKRFLPALIVLLVVGCTPVSTVTADTNPHAETVVLLHGLGRSPRAMERLAEQLERAGYRVESLGYSSLDQDPQAILDELRTKMSACCVGGQQPLHFVGHSLGGLLIRAYLEHDRPANLAHVVLLGTPNHGTVIVDRYRDNWWFSLLGPTAQALGTHAESFPNNLPEPTYPLGIIAGRKQTERDGLLPGDDDGLVAVESTKVEGMTDFVVIDVGHAAMRSDARVAKQTIAFLKRGEFVLHGSTVH